MRLKNTTDFADSFLRKMISWACKEIGLPVRQVKLVQVSRYSKSCRGTAYPWSGKIRVMIGSEDNFPISGFNYHGAMTPDLADRMEGLVEITAHELLHLGTYFDTKAERQEQRRRNGMSNQRVHHGRETYIVMETHKVLNVFRANRETLLAEWSTETTKEIKPAVSVTEQRQAKVLRDLERWQRKLKLAKTKVQKLTVKARYYERKAACSNRPEST